MKEKVQSFGRFLSGMVMPNIGAFIAWGLITAMFIATGWTPNEKLAAMVDPMLKYLLPLLIGYTGGRMVGGQRGAVVGAIASIGVIIGADIPMFLGVMIMGPLGGYCIKQFDKAIQGKVKAGFEMLVDNFSAGIIGGILAIIAFLLINPLCVALTNGMAAGVDFFVKAGLLPLAQIFIEPAKVLFLNNAINHGILTPLGIEQAGQAGKSIFFMLEANPGPGLGLLLAYCIAGKGTAKSSAPGAVIIHFLGGIHEIYFPYVMMNPILILAVIAGGITGSFVEGILGAGLVAAASPGSIIAFLLMTPKGGFFGTILGVACAAAVSFALSFVLLKATAKDEDNLDEAKDKVKAMKAGKSGKAAPALRKVNVSKIVFACDAGMGSSAMGATVLSKKLREAGLDIQVLHSSIEDIPRDVQIVVTHHELMERVKKAVPNAQLVTITNFMAAPEYDELVNQLNGLASAI
ncbi:PTS mannitol transporter subunit IICB [Caproiciproducens sp. R2]|jgi:PTS system mannitol-specific IIC component|uniref:PTS mannitol transporter subunit IICB n=1 Tax=Caproiciproducens sp. R2 TaxID=3435187 RepID=UPI004034693B